MWVPALQDAAKMRVVRRRISTREQTGALQLERSKRFKSQGT